MKCVECDKPIDESERYFWGRDGGEWHAACFDEWTRKGGITRGLYRQDGRFADNQRPESSTEPAETAKKNVNEPQREPEYVKQARAEWERMVDKAAAILTQTDEDRNNTWRDREPLL